jgi:hypothetical protein
MLPITCDLHSVCMPVQIVCILLYYRKNCAMPPYFEMYLKTCTVTAFVK